MTGRFDEIARGWRTILAAAAGACVGLTGLVFYSFGLFVKPLSATFGWSRGQIALGMTWITVGTVLTGPPVGILVDRFGVRRVAVPSLLGLAIAYVFLARMQGSIAGFYLACFGVALLGCATSPVTWTRAVSLAFDRNRGLALGLTMLGSALASLVGGPLLQSLIVHQGWRAASLAIAAFTAFVALPIVLTFMREPAHAARSAASDGPGLTLAEAVRTPPFWLIGFGILALIMAQSGLTVNLIPLLTDRGLGPVEAAAMAGLMGVAILVGRVGVGWLLDRYHPPTVAGLALTCPVAAAAIFATCGSHPGMIAAGVLLLGLGAGAEIDFLSYFTSRYFGLRAYGRIYGALFIMFSVGNGLGAPLIGAAYDHWGSYVPALWAAAVVFGIGALLFASIGRYPMMDAPPDAGFPVARSPPTGTGGSTSNGE